MSASTVPWVHGTTAGARRHYRRGEKPCETCRAAANAAKRLGDPYLARVPEQRGQPRNGLRVVAYEWRARAYPWAVAALQRAEAVYGTPEAELEAAS